jgi:phage terminase large subunit-like protein
VQGFSTQILDAVTRNNERGFTLAKSKSRNRIDAAVALCMAVYRATARQTAAPGLFFAFT